MTKEHLIEQHFSKSLSLEAQKEFDHLMSTDSDFEKAVTFQTNLKTVIAKEEQIKLKRELQYLENSTQKPKTKYIKWLVAASIVLLLAIPSFWYFGQSNLSNEDLFATNFEPYRNVVHPIVRGENYNDLKTKAFVAYESKNYNEALSSFDALLSKNDDATISFYKANVLLQLNKNDEAISILSENKNLTKTLRSQQQWYLALAYIKTDANEKAKTILKELINSSDFKKEQAKELLKQLN